MLAGLMQHDFPLTLQHAFERLRTFNSNREVVTLTDDGTVRSSYGAVAERCEQLARALRGLGIEHGDRAATFAWNTQRHLELYWTVPCMGAVLHTLNIRLFAEQLVYTINHAGDRVVFVDDSLVGAIAPIARRLETVERYVVMGDAAAGSELPNSIGYEELIAEQPARFEFPALDERQAAALCYTSGTTGNPRGVLYSHKSALLHCVGECMADAMGLCSADRVLPIVPMFHANAWGLPYSCGMVGAELILPGRFLTPEPLVRLIEQERVTVAGAVPTIWIGVLQYADEHRPDLSSLRIVPCGGSAVPRSLMQAFQERHGVRIVQAWGMTETSPLAAVAIPPAGLGTDEEWEYRTRAGRVVPLVELRIVDDAGDELPFDDEAVGEIEVRGPWVANDYYDDPTSAEKFHDGWLRTGDVASIDARGYIRITDRAKDVIKSGGEWISSVELENETMAHPAVLEAAVIAKPDERWAERPLVCVVLKRGAEAGADELAAHLAGRVARWWVPDEFAFLPQIPKTGTGKFDKKMLRQQLQDGVLAGLVRVGAGEGMLG